jgi:hypothetical protein
VVRAHAPDRRDRRARRGDEVLDDSEVRLADDAATTFSTGTTPRAARPLVTASKTSSNVAHGSIRRASGSASKDASSLKAPGAPW